eukprot:3787453-Rhodomonas_salina.3
MQDAVTLSDIRSDLLGKFCDSLAIVIGDGLRSNLTQLDLNGLKLGHGALLESLPLCQHVSRLHILGSDFCSFQSLRTSSLCTLTQLTLSGMEDDVSFDTKVQFPNYDGGRDAEKRCDDEAGHTAPATNATLHSWFGLFTEIPVPVLEVSNFCCVVIYEDSLIGSNADDDKATLMELANSKGSQVTEEDQASRIRGPWSSAV